MYYVGVPYLQLKRKDVVKDSSVYTALEDLLKLSKRRTDDAVKQKIQLQDVRIS